MSVKQKNTSKNSRPFSPTTQHSFHSLRVLFSITILLFLCGMLWSCKSPSSSDSALLHAPNPQNQQLAGQTPVKAAVSTLPPGYRSAADATARHALTEEGKASWYGGGKKFKKGRRTASGHAFDPSGYTAAHKFLPFGTMVRVFNLANNKSVDVRINDRGPYTRDRVIDVSRQAAKELGMIGSGVAQVRIEALNCTLDADDTLASEFWVQVNALANEKELNHLKTKAKTTKKELKVKNTAKSKKQKSRLLIGPYRKLDDALKVATEMHQRYDSAFVIAN